MVSEKLALKRKSLRAIELIQFILGSGIVAYSLFVLIFEQGANYLFYVSTLVLGVGFLSAAFLLAVNNHLYRVTATASFIALLILVILLAKIRVIIGVAGIFVLGVMYLLYIHPPNQDYYAWTKGPAK